MFHTKCVCPNPLVILGTLWPPSLFPTNCGPKTTFNPTYVFCDTHVHPSSTCVTPPTYQPYSWYPVLCWQTRDLMWLLWQHQNLWQQHRYSANIICKQFWYHHNNYYITMGNGTFKRTFQSHWDRDEILTESKRSLIQCNTVQ